MEDDIVEHTKDHAQAGDRPEEAKWEGSKSDKHEFEKQAQVLKDGGRIEGPYERKDGRVFLKLYDSDGGYLGQITNKVVIPHLVKLWDELKAERGVEGKESSKKESNLQLAFIRKDAGFPILKSVVENAVWYQDAMNEIGFTTLLIALQVGKMDPKNVAREIESFRDEREGKKRFIQLINKRLQALLEAHENADRITELERERDIMGVKLYATEIAFGEAKWQRSRFENHLQMAMACMCGPDMKRFMERQVYASVVSSSAGIGQNQEAVVVEGKGKGTLIE